MKNAKIIAILLCSALVILPITGSLAVAKNSTKALADKETVEVPVVNINDASSEELQFISGIGPKLAARIVQYREENGKFKSIDDIVNVRGVGTAKFAKIKEHLKV